MNAEAKSAEAYIAGLARNYRDATMRLHLFVSDAQRGLEHVANLHDSVLEKLDAAAKGEQVKPQPAYANSPMVELELERDEFELLDKVMKDAAEAMEHFPEMLVEMAFVQLVATFEAFFSDLLREVLVRRPELLKSSKRLTFEEAIEAPTKEHLICQLADKEIGALTYSSFRDQATYVKDRFGIELRLLTENLDGLAEAFARRNVLLHNAGIANERFADLAPESDFRSGERVEIGLSYFEGITESLNGLVNGLERAVIERFFMTKS